MRKQYVLTAAVFLAFLMLPAGRLNAAISLEQSTMTIPRFDFNGIFNELPLPRINFSDNARQLHQDFSTLPLQKYKMDANRFIPTPEKVWGFISGIGLDKLFKSVFLFVIGIVKFIAGVIIWVLGIIIELIRYGLSVIS